MDLLTILYRDAHIAAIDKPHSLLVHRSRQARDHVVAVQLLRDQINHPVWPVHRLDRATSGVLIFALDPETAGRCGDAFAARRVRKRYLAVVRGDPGAAGRIDHPMHPPGGGPPQDAVTTWRRLDAVDLPADGDGGLVRRCALLEVEPETGRRHQIRRHLKHIGHPIAGDTTYGDGRFNRALRAGFQCHRLMLHAADLWLDHPFTGTPLHLQAPLPDSMLALARSGLAFFSPDALS